MGNERYYELQYKYIELQKAFDDTLALNQKLGSENVKLEEQIKKMRCCENCDNFNVECRDCVDFDCWKLKDRLK